MALSLAHVRPSTVLECDSPLERGLVGPVVASGAFCEGSPLKVASESEPRFDEKLLPKTMFFALEKLPLVNAVF